MHSNSFYIMGNDDCVDQSASSKLSLFNSKDNPNIPIIEVSLILFIDGTLLKPWLEGLERKLKQLQLFLKCFFLAIYLGMKVSTLQNKIHYLCFDDSILTKSRLFRTVRVFSYVAEGFDKSTNYTVVRTG